MTAQVGEKLFHQGQHVTMCAEPLETYFYLGGTRPS